MARTLKSADPALFFRGTPDDPRLGERIERVAEFRRTPGPLRSVVFLGYADDRARRYAGCRRPERRARCTAAGAASFVGVASSRRCRGCDRLFEIEGCRAGARPRAPKGFVVEDHELVFYGRCAACAG